MKSIAPFSSSSFTFASSPLNTKTTLHNKPKFNLFLSPKTLNPVTISCKSTQNKETESSPTHKMEDYNTAMKRMMRNPYEYHHDLGMNYNLITENLIVGSQPQKPEDIDHLKEEQNVAYILNLQQDGDIAYWGIELEPIVERCKQLGIRHMRRPARDFDPDSLRSMLPKAVSSLEWAISEGKGRVYVHCTAGLGRAPAVAIAYMFWFCDMDLNTSYDTLTTKRPCGPNKKAVRGATYDLAKNDPGKEPFESLPENAFENVADWERKLIQERVRHLRGFSLVNRTCLSLGVLISMMSPMLSTVWNPKDALAHCMFSILCFLPLLACVGLKSGLRQMHDPCYLHVPTTQM